MMEHEDILQGAAMFGRGVACVLDVMNRVGYNCYRRRDQTTPDLNGVGDDGLFIRGGSESEAGVVEEDALKKHNEYRRRHGCSPLKLDKKVDLHIHSYALSNRVKFKLYRAL